MTNNTNITKIQKTIRAMYGYLIQLNDALEEAINDNTIDHHVRLALDAYYHELSDTELLDEIMDCFYGYVDEDEDFDSYENLTEEELTELIEDDYREEETEEDDEEELEIYNIYFNSEDFSLLYELTCNIGYGYSFDTEINEFRLILDEDMVDEIDDILDRAHYHEYYEENCSYTADRISRIRIDLREQVTAHQLY